LKTFKEHLNEAAFDPSSYLPTQDKTVELFLGRMQPVHLGHEAIIKKMKNPIVALVKGKASSEDKSRNPLSAKDQIKYLKKLFSSLDVLEVPTGFIPDIINAIRKDGKEVVTVYAGSDRIAGYKKMIDVYNKKLGDDQQMNVKFKKTPRVTSATTVRDAIRDDDIETFKKNMPKKLHSEWESLRKIIK
jgi:FAD synthase